MVYKLSDQLDHVGNSKYVFEAYDEYLKTNKNKLPESLLVLLASDWWYGGSGSTAPYYCELDNFEIIDFGKESAHLILTLIKKDHRYYEETPFRLRLIYQGILEFNIPIKKIFQLIPLCGAMMSSYFLIHGVVMEIMKECLLIILNGLGKMFGLLLRNRLLLHGKIYKRVLIFLNLKNDYVNKIVK